TRAMKMIDRSQPPQRDPLRGRRPRGATRSIFEQAPETGPVEQRASIDGSDFAQLEHLPEQLNSQSLERDHLSLLADRTSNRLAPALAVHGIGFRAGGRSARTPGPGVEPHWFG